MVTGTGQPGHRPTTPVGHQLNLGESPPRDLPNASRPPGFLLFDTAPCGVISGRSVACSGRVLMDAGDGRVDADRPVGALSLIAVSTQPVQDGLPPAVQRPTVMPVVDRLPVAIHRREITPCRARASPEEHSIDHHAVIAPPATPLGHGRGRQRLQLLPFLIGQVVPFQAFLIHMGGLSNPPTKIHGTRPSFDHLTDDIPAPPHGTGPTDMPAHGQRLCHRGIPLCQLPRNAVVTVGLSACTSMAMPSAAVGRAKRRQPRRRGASTKAAVLRARSQRSETRTHATGPASATRSRHSRQCPSTSPTTVWTVVGCGQSGQPRRLNGRPSR